MPDYQYEMVTSPHGREIVFASRPDTADLSAIGATNTLWGFSGNEYLLRDHPPMTGWAFDIGAHIGSVAVALAIDNPLLNVVAVEALAENCDVIRATIDKNKLFNIEVLEAAATDKPRKSVKVAYDWKTAENMEDSYVANNRFIGGMLPVGDGKYATPPGVSLTSLMKERDIERVRFLKIDCEGCEWQFLTSPDIGKVDEIIGEFHFAGRMDAIHDLLDATHRVQYLGGEDTIGIFWAHHHDLRP